MCGVVGYWAKHRGAANVAQVKSMADRLSHRGPDDSGAWIDEESDLALGHRRLSILDLSKAGHQPMRSTCGRYVLSYNGEIYNHLDLREKLNATGIDHNWRSQSDTETLLIALLVWGIDQTLKQLNGMFAFALWDHTEKTLHLARDRMGEKPMYYGNIGNVLLFGSELKAFTMHSEWQGTINRDALALYLRHNYIPAPWSIYKNIYKLPPAHYITIRNRGTEIRKPHCYWNLGEIATTGVNIHDKKQSSTDQLLDEFDQLLRDSVKKRMISDVPIGAFLSGGYDSTMIVAMMQQQSEKPVQTFTIGFNENKYNEAEHAKAVAKHLGTDHTELYVTSDQAIDVIPKLPEYWDEPFSDSSQIPTFLISKLAKQHVTVCLSGDGGDELFYGYNRYTLGNRIWKAISHLPITVRNSLSTVLINSSPETIDRLIHLLPKKFRISDLGDRLPKLAEIIQHGSDQHFYQDLVSHWKNPNDVVIGSNKLNTLLDSSDGLPALPGLREKMMYFDQMMYLPDDILTKVDRASMAVSLETRIPLLDHRIVEFAWRVPTSLKYHNNQGKWLLRQILHRYVPKNFMDRPKMGFGVPIDHWLRGPLKDWADNLLDESRLRNENIFYPQEIRKMWEEHITGKRRWHYYLWDILMFQAWADEQYKQ